MRSQYLSNFTRYTGLLESKQPESFTEFAENRLVGASKITQNAKEKGGDALLTYEHFRVKIPYYKKAAAGKFKLKEAQSELTELMKRLDDGTDRMISLKQTEFQQLVGKIEVLGELIIRHNSGKK